MLCSFMYVDMNTPLYPIKGRVITIVSLLSVSETFPRVHEHLHD